MRSSKEKYEIFHTWNEIVSQGQIWLGLLEDLGQSKTVNEIREAKSRCARWIFVGCGTSYYLAEAAAVTWSTLTGEPARAIPGSEVILFPELLRSEGAGLRAFAISRSGQTSETVRAARILKELAVPTVSISCARDSDLEKACERSMVLTGCDEKSTVMTRSFTNMLLSLQFLAARFADKPQFIADLRAMANQFAARISALGETLEHFASEHNFEDFVFLGQGAFHGIAREAALKLMEMSCSYSQFFHTLEFRHGPKAIVSSKTCLTFFLSDSAQEAEMEVLTEMKELGATAIGICNQSSKILRETADLVIEMNAGVHELALLAPYAVPGQFFGFFEGVRKGLNPDEPRNLARVVILD